MVEGAVTEPLYIPAEPVFTSSQTVKPVSKPDGRSCEAHLTDYLDKRIDELPSQ